MRRRDFIGLLGIGAAVLPLGSAHAEPGTEPGSIAGAAFTRFLADDTMKWTKIIQASGVAAE